jgi:hypothetical protein
LAHVPKLNNAVSLELENVDQGCSAVAGTLANVRMNRHQIAVFEHVLNVKHLVGIFRSVLLHATS